MGTYFSHQIDHLSEPQLTDYFSDLIASHSWSAVKLDFYGFKFYTLYVLRKPWVRFRCSNEPKANSNGGCGAIRRQGNKIGRQQERLALRGSVTAPS